MREINYNIFDRTSSLIVYPFTDKYIKELAEREDKSLSDIVKECREIISKYGVKYFITLDTNEIFCEVNSLLNLDNGFNTYKEAKEFLDENL